VRARARGRRPPRRGRRRQWSHLREQNAPWRGRGLRHGAWRRPAPSSRPQGEGGLDPAPRADRTRPPDGLGGGASRWPRSFPASPPARGPRQCLRTCVAGRPRPSPPAADTEVRCSRGAVSGRASVMSRASVPQLWAAAARSPPLDEGDGQRAPPPVRPRRARPPRRWCRCGRRRAWIRVFDRTGRGTGTGGPGRTSGWVTGPSTPRAAAKPWAKAVLPAPSSPIRRIASPGRADPGQAGRDLLCPSRRFRADDNGPPHQALMSRLARTRSARISASACPPARRTNAGW